ncbi:MAG: ABC transporter permease [Tannerellaceae bacterium]|jgi:putative ABC transport system permease protein|nr:ABC transporter permease [Tannerellaceae bacterium]
MNTILRNFLSVLRRFRVATALNVLGLSTGFAAFMIIIIQLDYDRSFNGSFPGGDRIFRMEVYNLTGSEWTAIINRPLAEAFLQSSPHIVEGGLLRTASRSSIFFSVEADGQRSFYDEKQYIVTPGYTGVFSFDMLSGSANALDEPDKVLIPQSMAVKIFGGDAMGKALNVSGQPTCIVGGVYRDFPSNSSVDNRIYRPLPKDYEIGIWYNWNYNLYVRLDEAANIEGLFENFKRSFDITTIAEGFSWEASDLVFRFTPLSELHYVEGVKYDLTAKSSRRTLGILLGIALLIVGIAGINYTNFSMALTPKRIRSINTQKILGAEVGAIRAALVGEALAVALLSYVIALAIVSVASDTPLTGLVDGGIAIAPRPALLTGIVAVATGIAAGLYPARYVTSFPPAVALKGSFGLSPAGRRLRNALISIQFIASFALIIGASFMFLQNRFMHRVPLGYDKDTMIVTNIGSTVRESRDAFADNLKRIPGVEAVTYAEFLLSGGDSDVTGWGWGMYRHDEEINFKCIPVEPSFLDIMGIEITEGRSFMPSDALITEGAYVFNETARREFGLTLNESLNGAEVVGFMPDINFASLRSDMLPMAFYAGSQRTSGAQYAYIKVRAGTDMRAAIANVRTVAEEFDGEYLFNVRFFDEVLNITYQKEQGMATLISLFSLVAILISIVGVFGLVVFESEYRRKEISLRKVFGSTTGEILVMFNKTYIRILCICFAIAAPLAWYAASAWLENFAYRTPLYWWVYAAAFAIVGILTVAVVTFQSLNAANANPAEAIKSE